MDDTQQIILNILKYAEAGQLIEFRLIKTWQEFKYCWQHYRSTKLIIKTLEVSSKNLFRSYCKDVIVGVSDVNKILAYVQLRDVIAFYKKDLDTLKKMLDEYDEYLGQGHFWHSVLGGERDIWNIR
jgi:hypothetical protein